MFFLVWLEGNGRAAVVSDGLVGVVYSDLLEMRCRAVAAVSGLSTELCQRNCYAESNLCATVRSTANHRLRWHARFLIIQLLVCWLTGPDISVLFGSVDKLGWVVLKDACVRI